MCARGAELRLRIPEISGEYELQMNPRCLLSGGMSRVSTTPRPSQPLVREKSSTRGDPIHRSIRGHEILRSGSRGVAWHFTPTALLANHHRTDLDTDGKRRDADCQRACYSGEVLEMETTERRRRHSRVSVLGRRVISSLWFRHRTSASAETHRGTGWRKW
jgi:hypothetical protein